jgi:putative membrane protein
MGAYEVVVLFLERTRGLDLSYLPLGLDAILTLVTGMVLLFRTNRAYERWWEARTLWGTLTNASRNLAAKVRALVRADAAEVEEFRRLLVSFGWVLRAHLGGDAPGPAPGPSPAGDGPGASPWHPPSAVVARMFAIFQRWIRAGQLSSIDLLVLDREARVLLEVCGGCERIKNTPIAGSWRTLTRQILVLFLISLPWGLYEQFGPWSIVLTMLTTYLGVAVESIAREVEEPFGASPDHLDLTAICQAIETSVSEILSQPRLP